MVTKVNIKLSDIAYHCSIGVVIRVLLSVYSVFHDKYFQVPYTDIDYKVYTFAAKEVIGQRSPYSLQAYRYSPIIAYILTPNILVHPVFGKLLASVFDVFLAFAIYRVVSLVYKNKQKALQCAQLWIYNPVPIIIATRGNMDSFSSIFVLFTLYCHLKHNHLASGALLGLSAHLRLYPVIFALPLLVTAGRYSEEDTLKLTYKAKLKFLAAFVVTLAALTSAFYYLYGYKFIDASILYHLYRHDIRHNFSLYFYVQYLDSVVPEVISKNFTLLDPKLTKNLLILVPTIVSLIAVTVKYNSLNHLPFALYCSAFIFVIFNKVLTAQYYIWYLSLLPLFLPSIILSKKKVIGIVSLWVGTQAVWLGAAYLLEFKGQDTFVYIHVASLLIYAANVGILAMFVNNYNAQYAKKVD